MQWIFYFVLVSTAVRANGPDATTSVTFDGWFIVLSYTINVISLSMGQFKVLKLGLEKVYIYSADIRSFAIKAFH